MQLFSGIDTPFFFFLFKHSIQTQTGHQLHESIVIPPNHTHRHTHNDKLLPQSADFYALFILRMSEMIGWFIRVTQTLWCTVTLLESSRQILFLRCDNICGDIAAAADAEDATVPSVFRDGNPHGSKGRERNQSKPRPILQNKVQIWLCERVPPFERGFSQDKLEPSHASRHKAFFFLLLLLLSLFSLSFCH